MTVGVNTLATLAVTGLVAILVYDWLGIACLRKGWISFGPLWSGALVATGQAEIPGLGTSRLSSFVVTLCRRVTSMLSTLISRVATRIGSRIWDYLRISFLLPLHVPVDNV
jgi:hypothetical protein